MAAPKSITDHVAMTTHELIARRIGYALEPLIGLPADPEEIKRVMERAFFDLIAEFEECPD